MGICRSGGYGNDTVLAYQISLGLGYAIREDATIDVRYRYSSALDPEFEGVEIEAASHNVLLGLRVRFCLDLSKLRFGPRA